MTSDIENVTIYREGGTWCYAAWSGPVGSAGGYDSSDTLEAETEDQARAEVAGYWPGARIVRVQDGGA